MRIKLILAISFFLAMSACMAQPSNDTVIINTIVDTSGTTFFQVVSTNAGPIIDSAAFVNNEWVRAHNELLPLRQATKVIALENEINQSFSAINNKLVTTSGKTYFQLAKDRGLYNSYVGKWRIIGQVDTVSVDAYFDVNSNGLATEINSLNDPTPVVDGLSCRFNPYEIDFFRINQLFPIAPKIVFLFEIVDEGNPNSARQQRQFWSNSTRSGNGGVRCIKFPDMQ